MAVLLQNFQPHYRAALCYMFSVTTSFSYSKLINMSYENLPDEDRSYFPSYKNIYALFLFPLSTWSLGLQICCPFSSGLPLHLLLITHFFCLARMIQPYRSQQTGIPHRSLLCLCKWFRFLFQYPLLALSAVFTSSYNCLLAVCNLLCISNLKTRPSPLPETNTRHFN